MHLKSLLLAFICIAVLELQGIAIDVTPIQRWVSSLSGLRLSQMPNIPWNGVIDSAESTIIINSSKMFQTMRGFGASFLESGAMNLNALPKHIQDELLNLLFSESGAHFSAMKAPIPCNDFCAAGPWYTYDDSPGDVNLTNFSIARDLEANGTLTFIKHAQLHGFDGILQSYMDYPPDWMLIGILPDFATVRKAYYPVLAQYFADFVIEYASHDVIINYLSMFNEPIDSYTSITNNEMAILLGDHVGPLFDKLGLRPRTKLTYGGQATRLSASKHIQALMKHTKARKYMDHFAFHGYDCQFNCTKIRQEYDKIAILHQQWPKIELFMTEICYAYNGDDPNCENQSTMINCTDWPRNHSLAPPLPRYAFDDGRIWGSRIVSDIESGVSAWIYWNLLLNMQGGPFQYSPKHNDDAENLQQAIVHINNKTGTYHTTGLFWYLAHFSKFVRPGMIRINVTLVGKRPSTDLPEGTNGIEAVGFLNGTTIVLQVLNHNNNNEDVIIDFATKKATVTLPSASITTMRWKTI